jgi:hypothetical protein
MEIPQYSISDPLFWLLTIACFAWLVTLMAICVKQGTVPVSPKNGPLQPFFTTCLTSRSHILTALFISLCMMSLIGLETYWVLAFGWRWWVSFVSLWPPLSQNTLWVEGNYAVAAFFLLLIIGAMWVFVGLLVFYHFAMTLELVVRSVLIRGS